MKEKIIMSGRADGKEGRLRVSISMVKSSITLLTGSLLVPDGSKPECIHIDSHKKFNINPFAVYAYEM